MPHALYKDGHLGPRSWRDPKTGTLIWVVAAAYLAPILIPFAIVAIYVAARCG